MPGLHVAAGIARRHQYTGDGGAQSGGDVGAEHDARRLQARGKRRSPVAADHVEVTAETCERQDQLGDNDGSHEGGKRHWHAEDASLQSCGGVAFRIDATPLGDQRCAAGDQRQRRHADNDGIGAEIADDGALQAGERRAEGERDRLSPAASPSGSAAMNTMPLVDSVTPSANDMMLPLSVMKVMPTATQPMKDVVFSSEKRLTAVKKPGGQRDDD